VTYSHPEGVRCHIGLGWDEDVDDYLSDNLDDEVDIDEFKDEIRYKICIWDACHESDLGILYCTADDIQIFDNKLSINCKGKHVYGSMTEIADCHDEIEFEMFVPFSK
jgi:hypothetical protein